MADVEVLQTRQYKDINLSFGLNPVTNDVLATTGSDAVSRALTLLIRTITGEAPFFPNFGSKIYFLLFEPIDAVTTALLQSELTDTITAFEPRVEIQSLTVTPDEANNQYELTLVYQIVTQLEPITLSLFLTRLR